MIFAETGRYPLSVAIKKSIIKYWLKVIQSEDKKLINIIYIEFTEINKHKKKLQIYIQQLMAAHIIVGNGYLKIE